MKYEHICFDLDGVLINSIEVMRKAWYQVQLTHDINNEFTEYKDHIGIPFFDILTNLKIPPELHQDVKTTYDYYSKTLSHNISLYDGTIEVLRYLQSKDIQLSVLTSKTKERTVSILKEKNIFEYLSYVICPEDLPENSAKPSPKALHYLMDIAQLKNSQILFLGDMMTDQLCAQKAKVDYCHCQYGYQPIEIAGASIENIRQLKDKLK